MRWVREEGNYADKSAIIIANSMNDTAVNDLCMWCVGRVLELLMGVCDRRVTYGEQPAENDVETILVVPLRGQVAHKSVANTAGLGFYI